MSIRGSMEWREKISRRTRRSMSRLKLSGIELGPGRKSGRRATCLRCGQSGKFVTYCSKKCKDKGQSEGKRYHWGGGRVSSGKGVLVYVGKTLGTVCGVYRWEHDLIAEQALGRRLKDGEVVHHVNGHARDNRSENLIVCTKGYHSSLHWRMSKMYQLEHFSVARFPRLAVGLLHS